MPHIFQMPLVNADHFPIFFEFLTYAQKYKRYIFFLKEHSVIYFDPMFLTDNVS